MRFPVAVWLCCLIAGSHGTELDPILSYQPKNDVRDYVSASVDERDLSSVSSCLLCVPWEGQNRLVLTLFCDPQAEIDKDLNLIAALFEEAKHIKAKEVYQSGAFSRTFAKLSFGFQGLPEDIKAHSPVTVASIDGETMLNGLLLEHAKFGDKHVRILYDNVDNAEKCYVGSHPEPVTAGCKLCYLARKVVAAFENSVRF